MSTLNDNPKLYQLKKVKLSELNAGDLFLMPNKTVFVKYSNHAVRHLRKDSPNVMSITGSRVGHHCTMNSESMVYVYKNPNDWFK